jgi:hypothetical protein
MRWRLTLVSDYRQMLEAAILAGDKATKRMIQAEVKMIRVKDQLTRVKFLMETGRQKDAYLILERAIVIIEEDDNDS